MDEFNNNSNPFNEENNNPQDPYNQAPQQNQNPYYDPSNQQNPYYNQESQQNNPYNQTNPYNQPYQQNYSYNQQTTPQQGYIPPQQGYGNYGYGMPPYAQNPSTGMAVASLVIGITSIVFCLFLISMPVLLVVPIIGIILGAVFKSKHLPVGKGLSTAGIITSVIGLILPILFFVLVIAFMPDIIAYIKETSPEQYQELYELYGEQLPFWFEEAISMFFRR